MARLAGTLAGPLAAEAVKTFKDQKGKTQCLIIVENKTNFNVTPVETVTRDGSISICLKPTISPGETDVMIGKANLLSLKGTNGLVALKVGDTPFHLVIKWLVPFIRTSSNRLAVGTCYGVDYLKLLLHILRRHGDHSDGLFRYKEYEYSDSVKNLIFDHGPVRVTANMSTTSPAQVYVILESINHPSGKQMEMADAEQDVTNLDSLNKSIMHDALLFVDFRVVGAIEIQNQLDCELVEPLIRSDGGQIMTLLRNVKPNTGEVTIVHKYPGTATGSYGTLSYYVKGLDCRVVLMWSLPFNHDFYSNWLALDVKTGRTINHKGLFKKMYENDGVVRQDYNRDIRPLVFQNEDLKITASMTTSHRAEIIVKVERR